MEISVRGENGTLYAICGIATDITDRMQAEEALRFAKFSIERAADAVYWVDPQAKILDVNEAASLMLGYSKEELCAMTVHDLNPDFQADGWPEFWAETQRSGTMVLETFHRAKNGRLIPIEVSVNYLSYEGKEYHCAFVRDITERKQAEEALRQKQFELERSQVQLQDLTSKLLTAQDSERQRIARDLHDDFSQRLAALTLDVASLQRHPPLLPELIGKALEPVREELTQLSDDLRQLAHRLHPSLLKHAGLGPAIEEHIHQAMRRTGLHITLKIRGVSDSLPLDLTTCLFRVFQESLQNVAKHAKATEVLVQLSGSSRGIGLSVRDNGTGFDFYDKSGHQKGLGLTSMKERLRLMNGILNIHSRPADGTKVCAWIPFREKTS
jgi:PAS domain S-box-containing protein